MHDSALEMAKNFFGTYSNKFDENYSVVEFGSKDNCEIKENCRTTNYKGLDLEEGKNVDIVLTDPYSVPLEDNSVDVLISSSCFEHVPLFWSLFLEGLRILKPDGLFYINAPSSGIVHRFPVDCWRFYPDSGEALVLWAKRNNFDPVVLESFIFERNETWKDCVSVFLKDRKHLDKFDQRICDGSSTSYLICNR